MYLKDWADGREGKREEGKEGGKRGRLMCWITHMAALTRTQDQDQDQDQELEYPTWV